MEKNELAQNILNSFYHEYLSSNVIHGDMPENMFEQITIVTEEIGEANQAVLKYHYENGSIENIKHELIQVGAMCLKMLIKINLK